MFWAGLLFLTAMSCVGLAFSGKISLTLAVTSIAPGKKSPLSGP